MSNSQLLTIIGIIALCGFSTAVPTRPMSQSDRENMIFIRGKWFNRNGKSNLPFQSTPAQIFKQCLHHMNATGCSTSWDQRYWVRRDYYSPGGPIFFQFGGEGPSDGMVDAYYWHNYASQYNAMLIVLEHRYYGLSNPTVGDNSFETLQLLTSQQALADAANFIEIFTENNNLGNASWVAFGGSYAGNLAAWMKAKYPHLIKTVVSSSGPLQAQLDFPGYLQTVSEVVRAVDENCYNLVYSAFECMESLINGTSCMGYTSPFEIPVVLQQCYIVNFNSQLDRETYFNIISMGPWAENWPSALIKDNCLNLTDGSSTIALEDYGDFLVRIGQADGDCRGKARTSLQSKTNEILEFIRTEEGRQSGAAGWFWQTCYEFGYYMSADPIHGLFGYETFSDLPYSSECALEYGSRFTMEYIESRIDFTNDYYEGKDLNVNCTIFVNGEWDPWHTLGINEDSETSSRNTVVFIPKAEHCDDMLSPKSQDMELAQARIQAQIGIYLNDPTC